MPLSHLPTRRDAESPDHFLATIVRSSDDAIFSEDVEGNVTSWNPAAERLLGYAPGDIIGRSATDLFAAADGGEAVSSEVLAGAKKRAGTTVLVRKDGCRLEVSLRASPVLDPSGAAVGVATIARDNSEQERIRLERDRATRELQRSNAELEQFAYVASHDLSEPLRMISGFVQLLAKRYEGQLDNEADEFIGFIVDGVKRMRLLIDDLLQYSRVGRSTLARETVDVADLVERVRVGLSEPMSDVGAQLTAADLPTIEADPTQLRRVFQNLISNSLKFRGEEPPRIAVSAEREEAAWRFTVTDNGIGIDSHQSERIFNLFERLHDHQAYTGTGLGLAICRTVVERHGGQIWATSGERGGTSFVFTLADDLP